MHTLRYIEIYQKISYNIVKTWTAENDIFHLPRPMFSVSADDTMQKRFFVPQTQYTLNRKKGMI